MIYKIYTLNDPITNEVRYVGYTKLTLEHRLKYHLKESNTSRQRSHKINWIKSLMPTINLIESTDDYMREIYWITEFKKTCKLTNNTIGGDGRRGPFPESGKEKLRLINTGKKTSSDTKLKLSRIFKGKPKSEEHIRKLRGIKRSDETKKRMSLARIGKKLSDDIKEKISKTLKGKIFPNQLENLKKARTAYFKNKILKKVNQFDKENNLINIFASAKEASRATNVKEFIIRDTCRGIQKTGKGYIWKYAN